MADTSNQIDVSVIVNGPDISDTPNNVDVVVVPSEGPGPSGSPGTEGTPGTPGVNGTDGNDGREVELRQDSGLIQWRYVGDSTWNTIVSVADLAGSPGSDGVDGADGEDGLSAYQLALNAGFMGTESEWLSSLVGTPGTDGENGGTGAAGLNGWTPTLSVATDGSRRVLQVTDWTGGTGSEPPAGLYVGASGLTAVLADAIDIRGATGAQGSTGATGSIDYNDLVAGETIIPRLNETSTAISLGNGTMRFSFFTARKTETITQIRVISGTTAGSAPTLTRFGIYSVHPTTGDLTLVASVVNDTNLLRAANTSYTRTLSASFAKTATTRYAIGFLVTGATTSPTLTGMIGISASQFGQPPRMAGFIGGQTDLPASVLSSSISDSANYPQAALLP